MATYTIDFTEQAENDLLRLRLHEPKSFSKVKKLIEELKEHPFTGTGKPEQLKGDCAGAWSRRISKKHRLVYEIHNTEGVVLVLSSYGHYGDK